RGFERDRLRVVRFELAGLRGVVNTGDDYVAVGVGHASGGGCSLEKAALLEHGHDLLADPPHGPLELAVDRVAVAAAKGLEHGREAPTPDGHGVGHESEEVAGDERRHGPEQNFDL